LCASRREAGGKRSGQERTIKNKNPTQRCGEKTNPTKPENDTYDVTT
jgi:hypothetical protein